MESPLKFLKGNYLLPNLISSIFHPVFYLVYFLLLLKYINPYIFSFTSDLQFVIVLIYVVAISIIFPTLPVAMMYQLNITKSLTLKDRQDRIIPLVISGVFYLWLFVNMDNNDSIPNEYVIFILGTTICLFVSFFISLFSKVSLHASNATGFLTGFVLITNGFTFSTFEANIMGSIYTVSYDLVVIILLVVCGIIGTSRLIMKAHTFEQVMGGYFIGVLSHLVASYGYFEWF